MRNSQNKTHHNRLQNRKMRILSTIIAVVLLLVLLFGSCSFSHNNKDSELLGSYIIQEFEDTERMIWTFDGKGSVTQSFYGYYRIEVTDGKNDLILSHDINGDGIHAGDFPETVAWNSILDEPSLLDDVYCVSFDSKALDMNLPTSYIFHPNGTYEKRTVIPYTYDGSELIFLYDIYTVSKDPSTEGVYQLKYKGNTNSNAMENAQFTFAGISMTLVPLNKNFDYEFYSVDGNENHVVAFMPEQNIFTFEIGTYTIENESTLILDTPTGEESYSFSNPTEDGFITLKKDGETFQYKTTASEDGFMNGFIKGAAPFEHYAAFYDQNSETEITFKEDGTFTRQNHYKYVQYKGYIAILDSFDNTKGPEECDSYDYQFTCDDRVGTLNLKKKNSNFTIPRVSYQLVRMDNFNDEGIEEGNFIGLSDREFKYMRVLIRTSPYAGEEDYIIYRIVYTDDLSVTGEQIYQDSISGTFIPFSEKSYQPIHTWQ